MMNRYDDHIIELLRGITMSITSRLNQICEPYGLTGVQLMILEELFQEDGLKISQLAHRTQMSNSNISAVIKRMEQHDFVHRVRNVNDQRIVIVCLNDKSHMLKADIMKKITCDTTLCGCTSKEDQEIILKGLEKLHDIVKEMKVKEHE